MVVILVLSNFHPMVPAAYMQLILVEQVMNNRIVLLWINQGNLIIAGRTNSPVNYPVTNPGRTDWHRRRIMILWLPN